MEGIRRRLPGLLPILLLLVPMLTGLTASDGPRRYPVYKLAIEPKIDGQVDHDLAWDLIPTARTFVTPLIEELETYLPAYKQTSFRMGYLSDALYVAVVSQEPWTRYLADEPQPDEPFETDDGIEILMSHDGQAMLQFVVNAVGSRFGRLINGSEIPSDSWKAVTSVTESSYAVEIRIPFSVFEEAPQDGDVWMTNVIRNTRTIISPEDRQTGWSPVSGSFERVADLGKIVFHDEVLNPAALETVQTRLDSVSRALLAKEDEFLVRSRDVEAERARSYLNRAEKTGSGFASITRGPADLTIPPTAPDGEIWRYGLGFPIQIGPKEAALLANIRLEGSGNIDFEIGTDVILFDDLENISAEHGIPISRYERKRDPEHGEIIVRKGPVIAGFVPLGALLDDGSPHPAAGTGFGICWSISHEIDENGKFEYTRYIKRNAVLYQFTYDGEKFEVVSEQPIDASSLLPDWNLVGNFVTSGIADGEDLLYVMVARVDDVTVAGYTRWMYGSSGWYPVSFTPVTGFDLTWSEPSLIRDADGDLMFSARSYDRAVPVVAFDIAVWRSADGGANWKQVIYEKNRRARSPVSINRTADGTPFIAGNIPPLRRTREVLAVWPLDKSRTQLAARIIARNAPDEYGPAPSGSWWRLDHPTSAVLRLADGNWHAVLSYRTVDNGEVESDAPPAPQTGTYVEEVFSFGDPVPPWSFGD